MFFKPRNVTEGFTECSESSQKLSLMGTVEKLHTPSFRLFPNSLARQTRAASPAPGLAAYGVEAFACTTETPEPRRGQNQRSGHSTDCRDGRRRIRGRAVQARGRWRQ